MAMEMAAYHRQLVCCSKPAATTPTGIVFDSVTGEHMDDGLLSRVSYFTSYSF